MECIDSDPFQLFTSLRYDSTLVGVPRAGIAHAGWNSHHASPYYMLDFHRDRMLRAAAHWGWDAAINTIGGDAGLARLESFLASAMVAKGASPLKVKVVLTKTGELSCETMPVPATPLVNLFPSRLPAPDSMPNEAREARDPSKDALYKVILDHDRTNRSEYTHFKTTKRAMYEDARQRAGIQAQERKEVLIINAGDGLVMEGSSTTPYFWRRGCWVTPSVSPTYSTRGGSGGQDGTSRRWALERGLAVEDEVNVDTIVVGEECWLSSGVRGFMSGRIVQLEKADLGTQQG